MAAEWVKFRVWLARDPKTIRMAGWLSRQPAFQAWLFPGADPETAERYARNVTPAAVTAVTMRGLLQVWGVTQERGTAVTGTLDVTLKFATLDVLDELAEIPCFGRAMAYAEWATEQAEPPAVVFPNLCKFLSLVRERGDAKEDRTAAERMRRFRQRQREAAGLNGDGQAVTVTPRNVTRVTKAQPLRIKRRLDKTLFGQTFDPKNVTPDNWDARTWELLQTLPPTGEDRRIVAQVAWLLEAGLPIANEVRVAAAGVKAVDPRPDLPVAYFAESLRNALGSERFETYLAAAPKRSECIIPCDNESQ